MVKKYRKHRKIIKPEFIIPIPVKKETIKIKTTEKKAQITLTEEDLIVYIYENDEDRKTIEVVNVSYQILIKGRWITIVRFDSEHGYLHRHRKVSVRNEIEIVSTAGVVKKGSPRHWLTWAVEHLKENYPDYRKNFLKEVS